MAQRVSYLSKTPFFLYLDTAQLNALAESFSTSKSIGVGQAVQIHTTTIYVMCKGQLEMSTLLPTSNNKSGQSRGYLCKKVAGDIVNKKATNNDAKRKVSSAKLHSFVEEVQTVATEESLIMIADMLRFDTFLSTLSPPIKQKVEKMTNSVIFDALESLPFLIGMKKTQLTMLAGMCRYEAVGEGENIFCEGDRGDKLYIVLSGECSVHVKETLTDGGAEGSASAGRNTPKLKMSRTNNGELFGRDSRDRGGGDVQKRFSLDSTESIDLAKLSEKEPSINPTTSMAYVSNSPAHAQANEKGEVHLALLKDNDYFGETALMVNIPRTTTVTAVKKSLFITVCKAEFQNFLQVCPTVKSKMELVMKERMIGKLSQMKIPFFKGVTDLDMDEFSVAVEMHEFDKDSVVFKEGDQGDRFFIIIHGEVRVEHSDPEKVVDIGHLGPGKYFGEMALVSDDHSTRNATIVTNSHSILLSIGKDIFHKFFDNNPLALLEFKLRLMEEKAELRDLLNHPNAQEAFRTYLAKELATESLDFWATQDKFTKAFDEMDEEERRGQAKEIFGKYISQSAEFQVNIPGKMRVAISNVLDNGEAVEHTLFDHAAIEVYKLMVRDNYARFKRTKEFSEFFLSLGILIQNKDLVQER